MQAFGVDTVFERRGVELESAWREHDVADVPGERTPAVPAAQAPSRPAAARPGGRLATAAADPAPHHNASPALQQAPPKHSKYKGLKLVATVYGDDETTVSTTQAQGLLTKYPNLKVIVAPTTVGILAAAQVVKQAGKSATVKVTGLGFPNDMKPFVTDGTSPVFGLWSVPDLGYLPHMVAAKLVSGETTRQEGESLTAKGLNGDRQQPDGKDGGVHAGRGLPDRVSLADMVAASVVGGEIPGKEGESFTVKGLNGDKPYTIGKDGVVILGPAFRFDKTNVDNFNF